MLSCGLVLLVELNNLKAPRPSSLTEWRCLLDEQNEKHIDDVIQPLAWDPHVVHDGNTIAPSGAIS